ncbi:hypothetical protein ACS0TY_004915 [Phlomoides rotata]
MQQAAGLYDEDRTPMMFVLQSRTNPASVTWKGGAVLGIHDFTNHGYIARTGSGTGFILVVIESIKIFIFFKHKLCVT